MPAFPKPTATETDPVASPTAAAALALAGTMVPKSTVTTKGDVIAATGNAAVARVGVGSDGQVLTADAASAAGVKWAAAATTPSDASTSVKGITKLSVAPVSASAPIAVGDNDSRMTDARTPTGTSDTLIDAKGDIIVGTADNTRARRAVGANGLVLTAASGQSDGLQWLSALPFPTPASGDWIAGQFGTGNATGTNAQDLMYATPIWIPTAITTSEIDIVVNTAVASAVIRLGIYSSTSGNKPGTLLVDAGTVAAATTGVKGISLTQALSPGLYWLAAVAQTAAAKWRSYANSQQGFGGAIGASNLVIQTPGACYYRVASVTGGLPSSPTWAFGGNDGTSQPVIGLVVA